MPELPDVEMYRKEAEKCKNSAIERIQVNDSRFVKVPESKLMEHLHGKRFNEVVRRGKYLFLKTGKREAVVLHFGMTGQLLCRKQGEEKPRYSQCCFEFKNRHMLHVVSRRKLGSVDWVKNSDAYIKAKELGPDALEISKEDFMTLLQSRQSMIKSVLTDQSAVSGIGNIYSDEILYQAKIHPRQRASQLSEKTIIRLYEQMHNVLRTAIDRQADVSKLPDNFLSSVRGEGNNCPACKGKIKQTKIAGRSTYFCPSCQKPPK